MGGSARLVAHQGSAAEADSFTRQDYFLISRSMSCVLAAQPAEVQPPVPLCPDWGWAWEGNYRLRQEMNTPGHLLCRTESARAATLGYF